MHALHLNEQPSRPLEPVIKAMKKASMHTHRYPESSDIFALQAAIGEHHGIEPEWVTIGNGSSMLIHQIMIAAGQKEVLFGWPSFIDFPVMADGLGMNAVPVETKKDGSIDFKNMLSHITKNTSLIIVCTPNPPIGGIVTHKDTEAFIKRVPSTVTILLDEAYGEFVRDPRAVRAVDLVKKYPNVVMTRSFSKAYGLAGLRVGYSIASLGLTAKIRAAGLVRFEISAVAFAGALAAITHHAEATQRVEEIISERSHMSEKLQKLGVEVVEGHGNFIWLPVGDATMHLREQLAKHDVLVSSHAPFGIRITVGSRDDTNQLIKAWQQVQPLNFN